MYDRQTESWWQQATEQALAGEFAGDTLHFIPAATVSWMTVQREPRNSGVALMPRVDGVRRLRYAPLVVVPRDFCHITCTMPPGTGYILPIGGISMRCSSSTLFFVQSQQVYA